MSERCGNTIHTEYLTEDLRRCRKERGHEGHCLFGDGVPTATADKQREALSERELNAIKWAVPIIRGVEDQFGEQAGVREGEAMSDVLAGIVSRAVLASEQGQESRD